MFETHSVKIMQNEVLHFITTPQIFALIFIGHIQKNMFFVIKVDNIGSLLIHNRNIDNKKYNFVKCSQENCKICIFSSSYYFIKLNDINIAHIKLL